MTKFTSLLVANRGEIACRIIRTAKAQGYRTVAVYSEADATAPHVSMADEAVFIGPSPVNESYLVQEKIIEAARSSNAEAIHPGYGFLSENSEFAEACSAAGIVFIGPSSNAIHLMGNKAEAKRLMLNAKVPCVPGYEGEDQSDTVLVAEGEKIGPPLMVKAAAGGGGRGMRLVHEISELPNAIKLARAEAESAFGNGDLILEKAISRPRHVEVQVFADVMGSTIHLGERDCSVQRRHQKVVEEAPCPVMTDALRAEMGAAAVAAAKSISYCGAGTVEFLLDEQGSFYFLEMNTRLQVEHPVTELITGLDLVALQLQVAQDEPLGLDQEDISLEGHAIEVRLYTEDPAQDFLPTSGPVDLWSPASGIGVRVDAGICSGQEISPFYDPMVAKVIAHGPTRDIARLRLIEALNETVLFGATHNRDFLVTCLEKDVFIEGKATTAFIAEEFTEEEFASPEPTFSDSAVAAVLELALEHEELYQRAVIVAPELRNWSSASPLVSRKKYVHSDSNAHDLNVTPIGDKQFEVFSAEETVDIELTSMTDTRAQVSIDGTQHLVRYLSPEAGRIYLSTGGRSNVYEDQIRLDGQQNEASGSGQIVAPMHGLLLEIRVEQGDRVKAGQTLAVLEAMKMHYEIVAEAAGTVTEVLASPENQVAADDLLIEIDTNTEEG
ncbi:MAG: biotin carboxylase N-terminal domain-containing protein [Halioglobus sp.]